MDRLLTSVRSHSWLLLLRPPTRHLSSFKARPFELKSQALLQLVRQFESSKQKSVIPSLPDYQTAHELNYRFPLPGRVGLSGALTDGLSGDRPLHDDSLSLETMLTTQEKPVSFSKVAKEPVNSITVRSHDCSPAVRSELRTLFLNYDASTQPLTAIMVVFPTKSDMSTWSPEVENERKQLAEQFTTLAQEISTHLTGEHYWVDFIDPSNGKPFYGPPTSDALFETDERLRHFGIQTNDLGCCRVIEDLHHGTNVFIGCIFTSASTADPEVQNLLDEFTVSDCLEQD